MKLRLVPKLRNPFLPVISFPLLACLSCSTSEQQTNRRRASPIESPQAITSPSTTTSSREKLILKGRLDCRTTEVQTTAGVLENHFDNLREVSAALSDKGYDGQILHQIEELKLCKSQEPKTLSWTDSPMAPVRSSSLLEIEAEEGVIWFSLLQTDFTGFTSLTDYLMEIKSQEPCKKISEKCVKCPDKKIYCTDEKSFQ
jgi:hypothetical protein